MNVLKLESLEQNSLISEIGSFLRSIPDVVWSGVIASVLTLSGVLISNASNTKRLRMQLNHNAEENIRERTADMRKLVYMRAAEELARVSTYLGTLPQADLTKVNVGVGMQDFFGAAAQLQLVAEPKTALVVGDLAARYGELLLRLMKSLGPLQDARSDIAINDELYNKVQAEIGRILATLTQLNESAQPRQFESEALLRSFEFHQEQANKLASQRDEAGARFSRLNIAFCRQLLAELSGIQELQVRVLVEVRRDLGLTTDLDVFRTQLEAQAIRIKAEMNALIDALQAQELEQEGD